MKHFDLGRWMDYVRGVAAGQELALLEAHLADGCPECRQTVELLSRIAEHLSRQAAYEPPAALRERAVRIFPPRVLERPPALPVLAARLLYDSFRDPQPLGVRSSQRAGRQVLYEAGDFSIDLRLENESPRGPVTVVGQIANRSDPEKPVSGVPVFVLAGEEVLTSGHSNQYGEFQIESLWKRNLRLCVPVAEAGKRIEVPLSRLLPSESK
jgi:hypothetical protein